MFGRVEILSAALAGAALCVAPAHSANLLANPGFETGDFSGWTVGGTNAGSGVGMAGEAIAGADPALASLVTVHGGAYAAYTAVSAPIFESMTLSQTLLLSAGFYGYEFFVGAHTPSFSGFASEVVHTLVDGVVVSEASDIGSIPQDGSFDRIFGFFSIFVEGLHTIAFDISGSNLRLGISVDDFSLDGPPPPTAAPEPASSILLATFAGAGLLAFRRRRLGRASA